MELSRIEKYFSPVRYGYRFLALINKVVLQYLDIITAPDYEDKFKYPPVFFLGAPRSGSTLIYQVVTDGFDVSYLSNRHCQFFGSPALAERLFNPLGKKVASSFSSHHGETKGWSAPSECGQWWYRFFRRTPAYVTLADVEENKMRKFRRSLLALTEASDKPVIFKNLYASLRLEAIAKHIPEALFIIIDRDELDNGHSLLEVRYKLFGNYDEWWSLPPPGVEGIKKKPAHVQVIEQVRGIHRTILSDLKFSNVPESRMHRINYEKFCNDVHREIFSLEKFFSGNSCVIKMELSNIPKTFDLRTSVRIDSDVYSSMKKYINE